MLLGKIGPHLHCQGCMGLLGVSSYYRRYIQIFASVATPLTALTKKDAKRIWNNDCKPSLRSRKLLVQPPVLTYPTGDGPFVFSTDASDTRMGAVLEQEQEEDRSVVRRVKVYALKTLTTSQHCNFTTDKELLAVVTAMELFKSYLTGRHFTVATDYAIFIWLRNQETQGVVAKWITRLQPFDFKIMQRTGKQCRHADGLSYCTSRPCKRDSCPVWAPLLYKGTPEEDMVRAIT